MTSAVALADRMLGSVEMTRPVNPWTMAARAGYRVRVNPDGTAGVVLGATLVVPGWPDEERGDEVLRLLALRAIETTSAPVEADDVVRALRAA